MDGLLEDRQAHVFAPWRQTYQLPLGLQNFEIATIIVIVLVSLLWEYQQE